MIERSLFIFFCFCTYLFNLLKDEGFNWSIPLFTDIFRQLTDFFFQPASGAPIFEQNNSNQKIGKHGKQK